MGAGDDNYIRNIKKGEKGAKGGAEKETHATPEEQDATIDRRSTEGTLTESIISSFVFCTPRSLFVCKDLGMGLLFGALRRVPCD